MKKNFIFIVIASIFILSSCVSLKTDEQVPIKSLSIPGLEWVLEIDLTGFDIVIDNFGKNYTSRYILGSNKETELNISVFIEKAQSEGDATTCREFYGQRLGIHPFEMKDVSVNDLEDRAFLEYMVESHKGQTINQKHMNIYMAHDGYWIDIHISKAFFRESDELLFDEITDKVKINTEKTSSFRELFIFSSTAFMDMKLESASLGYELLLKGDFEELKQKTDNWYVCFDNLAMCYGVMGKTEKAKKTIEKGLAIDPEYPMFYYILACVSAESSDIKNAIENLEKAFKYEKNSFDGKPLPNPKNDPSFNNYLGNEEFNNFLERHGL